MKTVLMIILFVHAIIHFIGFIKAFELAEVSQLSLEIPKSLGILWLMAGILFLQVIILFNLGKIWWPFFGIAAVIISQVLIILSWQDAKFGTVANILILFTALPAMGNYHFQNMLEREKTELSRKFKEPSKDLITNGDIVNLPEIIQKWMKRSGVIGRSKTAYAHLVQSGKMRTKPGGKWMDFKAEQTVDLVSPAFIWNTEVDAAPMVRLVGRDKFEEGKGEMLIKVLSLVNVVDEKNHFQINTGAMLRYLGEICWYPSAALNDNIVWQEIGENSAKAIFRENATSVEGVFHFSEEGDLLSFEALRYYGGGKDSKKELWHIEALEYSNFSGYRIPNKCNVTWKLADGDFTWLQLQIQEIYYNPIFY